jgi:hypothetical protein
MQYGTQKQQQKHLSSQVAWPAAVTGCASLSVQLASAELSPLLSRLQPFLSAIHAVQEQ